MREYYDKPNGRARYEINSQDNITWIVVDFRSSSYYLVKDMATCQKLSFNPSAGYAGYLPSEYRPLEVLTAYGNISAAQYMGQDSVRGILCDVFQLGIRYQDGPFNLTIHTLNLTLYYTAGSWSFGLLNATSRPMRVQLNGTRAVPRSSDSWDIFYINNFYELINFVARPPLPALFDVPDECLAASESVLRLVYTTSGANLAAGMFFLGFFIGIILLAIAYYGYKKYQVYQEEEKRKAAEERAKRRAKKKRAAARRAAAEAQAEEGLQAPPAPPGRQQQPHDSPVVRLEDEV